MPHLQLRKSRVSCLSFRSTRSSFSLSREDGLLWDVHSLSLSLSLSFVTPRRIRSVFDSRKIKIPSRPGNNASPAWRHWLIFPMERRHRSRVHVALCSFLFDLPLSFFRRILRAGLPSTIELFVFPIFGGKDDSSTLLASFAHDRLLMN